MSTGMDIFLTNSSDSMPFSDFEFKQDLEQFLTAPFSELPSFLPDSLELSDSHECKFVSSNSNQSMWDFSGDDGPAMINPNAVLPLMTSTSTNIGRSPSPSVRESHLTFSPGIFKIAPAKVQTEATVAIKKNLNNALTPVPSSERKQLQSITPIVKSVTKVTPILAKPITIQRPIVIKNASFRQTTTTQIVSCSGSPVSIRTMPATSVVAAHSATIQQKNVKNQETVNSFRIYPKPAYSYSCLIAMALKNSKNGSLPVSEIYNFMCRHFPYFKTAPSGWKNSVRHNLSLNKCFEKIEKPALNGAQRKGCLWAMNPAKISKMDEEVQKWSKKDPMAIKKAMVNPENLEALERGELKFSCPYDDNEIENFGDSCGSADSGEGTDSELDSQEEMESEETEIEMKEMQIQYIHLKTEPQEEDYDEIEVKEEVIVDDWEDDKEQLRTEVALAKKELEFDLSTNKRRRTYLMQTF